MATFLLLVTSPQVTEVIYGMQKKSMSMLGIVCLCACVCVCVCVLCVCA